jgi:maltose operon periplasmic protein
MGMTQGKQSWLWLVGLLAAGCSSMDADHGLRAPATGSTFQQQAQADRQQLAQASAIEKFQNITFQPLGDVSTWVQIGSSNQVFSFDTGKSYVAAFSLPAMPQATRVKITVPIDFTLFLPSVMILDEHYTQLQLIPGSTFTYAGGSLLAGQNMEGEFTIPASSGASRAAYMLLFTTTEDMQGTTKMSAETLQRAMEYDRASDVARLRNAEVPHAATGRLYLALETQPSVLAVPAAPQETSFSPAIAAAAAKPLSEQEYYQRIRSAVAKKEYEQAIAWVNAAEKAGFTQARGVFFAAQP